MGRCAACDERAKAPKTSNPLDQLEPDTTNKEAEESLDYVLATKDRTKQIAAMKTLLEIAQRRGTNRTFVFLERQAQQAQVRFDEDKF